MEKRHPPVPETGQVKKARHVEAPTLPAQGAEWWRLKALLWGHQSGNNMQNSLKRMELRGTKQRAGGRLHRQMLG